MTGERLKELGFPYTSIIRSTMTRATQTAKLIQKYLPDVPVKDCSMLEEGAPILPEPPHSTWKPEYYVSVLWSENTFVFHCLQNFYFYV